MAAGSQGLSYSEAAILLLVHRGVDSVEALARALNADPREVRRVVEGLAVRGLVEVRREGRLFRRERVVLTRRGLDAVPEAARVVREAAQAALRAAEAAREAGAPPPGLPGDLAFALPALALLGLLPAWALAILLPGAAVAPLEPMEVGEAYEDEEAPVGDVEEGGDLDFDLGGEDL